MSVPISIGNAPNQFTREFSTENALRMRGALRALFPILDENDEPISIPPEQHLMRWIAHEARRLVKDHERRQQLLQLPDADVLTEAP